ncbi:MAG: tRNA (guanosine(18)-2'-O)-methyltransferase TrmH [Pseudomonadota bacterium]
MTPERFAKLRARLDRRQPDLTVLAENTHKTHNIAAMLRTADAVGLFTVHAVFETTEFRHHHRVAGGARKWVNLTLHDSTRAATDELQGGGFRLLAAHPGVDAIDYREIDYTQKTALVMGSELDGISDDAASAVDAFVSIPMEGMGASLNVSVAAALLLYEARRQREVASLYDHCRISPAVYEQTLFEWAYPDLATRCRQKKRPYPALGTDGELLSNPLANTSPA